VYESVATERAVYVTSDNRIGTLASSRRYKEQIKPMEKASETIRSLRPVSFRYKKEIDPAQPLCFGLIAEEVADVNPNLVTLDCEGKPETVRYEAINAMLLSEFIKQHKAFVEEHHKVEKLEATVSRQQKQIEALAADLETVSSRLELSKAESPTIANN
jgi:endosialidase-like protein